MDGTRRSTNQQRNPSKRQGKRNRSVVVNHFQIFTIFFLCVEQSHGRNKKQCSRQLQCEIPWAGDVVSSSLFVNSSLSSLSSPRGGPSGGGGLLGGGGSSRGRGQGIFHPPCHILHCHIVLRPKGTSHNEVPLISVGWILQGTDFCPLAILRSEKQVTRQQFQSALNNLYVCLPQPKDDRQLKNDDSVDNLIPPDFSKVSRQQFSSMQNWGGGSAGSSWSNLSLLILLCSSSFCVCLFSLQEEFSESLDFSELEIRERQQKEINSNVRSLRNRVESVSRSFLCVRVNCSFFHNRPQGFSLFWRSWIWCLADLSYPRWVAEFVREVNEQRK